MSTSLNKILLKIRTFLEPPSTAFNPTWKAYKLLFVGVFFLCFSFWVNYDRYQHGGLKKIAIESISQAPINTVNIGTNTIEISQKSELVLKPQSYWQQLIFDLDPNADNVFSLSFALLFFVISVGVFFILRNTSKSFQFSKNVLASLNKFYFLIYVVVIMKVLLVLKFNSDISTLIDPKIHLERPFYSIGLGTAFIYGLFATLLITLINFFKQGLVLQEEQDLTV
ncbi:MAG TPA: DUF2975 domain-containing protein [Pelobium sp.]|nr:DUF2975 domain-containing protein [Pelobium sp.]